MLLSLFSTTGTNFALCSACRAASSECLCEYWLALIITWLTLLGRIPYALARQKWSSISVAVSLAFKAFHSRGHGTEMVQAGEAQRVQMYKLWLACLLLTYLSECTESWHGMTVHSLLAIKKFTLNQANFPVQLGKGCVLQCCYPSYLLLNMFQAGAYLVAPSAPLLSWILSLFWLLWCCPFCSK